MKGGDDRFGVREAVSRWMGHLNRRSAPASVRWAGQGTRDFRNSGSKRLARRTMRGPALSRVWETRDFFRRRSKQPRMMAAARVFFAHQSLALPRRVRAKGIPCGHMSARLCPAGPNFMVACLLRSTWIAFRFKIVRGAAGDNLPPLPPGEGLGVRAKHSKSCHSPSPPAPFPEGEGRKRPAARLKRSWCANSIGGLPCLACRAPDFSWPPLEFSH